MATLQPGTASRSSSAGSSDIRFPSRSDVDDEEDRHSSFSDESENVSASLFWDQNDRTLRSPSFLDGAEEAHARSPSSPPTIEEADAPQAVECRAQADMSASQASFGTIKSNASAAEPMEGYLNISARRGEVTRTFSLPPSVLSDLTYATLLHILELDVPLRHSRWSNTSTSSRRSLRRSTVIRSIFEAGEKLITAPPEVWLSHSVAPAPLSGLRMARTRSQKRWYKLQSFALVDAERTLFDALMAQLLREHVERNTWLTLLVRQPGEEVPQEAAERGPTGLDRVGKGISRLSIGLGSLFGALDLSSALKTDDERVDQGAEVDREMASGSTSTASSPEAEQEPQRKAPLGKLGRVWRALTGSSKSRKTAEEPRSISPPPRPFEEDEAPQPTPARPAPRSATKHGTIRILSRTSSRHSPPPELDRISQASSSRIIQRALSKRSQRSQVHVTGTEVRRDERTMQGEDAKRAPRERTESTARKIVRALSVRRRISSSATTESERWERAEAERLRKREWVPVEQAASQDTRPSLQERPDIDAAALRREPLDSPSSSTFAVLDHSASQPPTPSRRIEKKRLPLVPPPPGWQVEQVAGWKVEPALPLPAKDPFADDQRAENDRAALSVNLHEANTSRRRSKGSRRSYSEEQKSSTTPSQRSGKSRRSPPPPPPPRPRNSRGYSFLRRPEDASAPLRPGGAEIIGRPADAGLNAVYL